MLQILRGDKVHVVNGIHKGKAGVVQAVIRKQNRVIVEGVNLVRYTVLLSDRVILLRVAVMIFAQVN